MISEEHPELTPEFVLSHHISMDINKWLHKKGEDIDKYSNYIDRVFDIAEVVRGAFEKAKINRVRIVEVEDD